MLDKALIHGFYKPELVDAQWCFHSFETMKTPKKTPRELHFRKVGLLSPKKCKTIQRRTLLSQMNYGIPFSSLVSEVQKMVQLSPDRRSFISEWNTLVLTCEGKKNHSEISIYLLEWYRQQ